MKTRNTKIVAATLIALVTAPFSLPAFGSTTQGQTQEQNRSPIDPIVNRMILEASKLTPAQYQKLFRKQFRQMRLLDAQGNWADPILAQYQHKLLPDHFDSAEASAFLQRIAAVAKKNRYLVDFIERASHSQFKKLQERVDLQGHIVFPVLVSYAVTLDNLTRLMREDYKVLKTCADVWQAARKRENLQKRLDWFDTAKLYSVEIGIKNIIQIHETQELPTDFLEKVIPLNIAEAVAKDLGNGNTANARTGITLARNGLDDQAIDSPVGQGPARWSDDRKALQVGLPLATQWADLYENWNLAFVSSYTYAPFVMVKLLIPSVADHYAESREYIYNRGLALYAHLHYSFLGRADGPSSLLNVIDWQDQELTTLWGEVNLENAQEYQTQINQKKRTQQ